MVSSSLCFSSWRCSLSLCCSKRRRIRSSSAIFMSRQLIIISGKYKNHSDYQRDRKQVHSSVSIFLFLLRIQFMSSYESSHQLSKSMTGNYLLQGECYPSSFCYSSFMSFAWGEGGAGSGLLSSLHFPMKCPFFPQLQQQSSRVQISLLMKYFSASVISSLLYEPPLTLFIPYLLINLLVQFSQSNLEVLSQTRISFFGLMALVIAEAVFVKCCATRSKTHLDLPTQKSIPQSFSSNLSTQIYQVILCLYHTTLQISQPTYERALFYFQSSNMRLAIRLPLFW